MSGFDSAGRPIAAGDKVQFRGEVYTIEEFIPGAGRGGCNGLVFDREPHVDEKPDEWAVDRVEEL